MTQIAVLTFSAVKLGDGDSNTKGSISNLRTSGTPTNRDLSQKFAVD